MRVRTPDHLPFECRQTLNNLGNLFYGGHHWDKALEAYSRAIIVTEQIRGAALEEAARRRVPHESWQIFERGVLAAARCEKYTLALALAERGKARKLADSLWRREVKPLGVSEADWQEYQGWLARQRAAESGGALRERGAALRPQQVLEELGAVSRRIAELEARFLQADPDYAPLARPLQIEDIAALARGTGAVIVDFRVTSEGGFVFLAGPEDHEVAQEQVVELPGFTSEALREFWVNWLTAYYRRDAHWQEYLESACGELYKLVWAGAHQRLRERYPKTRRLIVVPNQGLSLLPLHAAWYKAESGERRYLLDDYEIAYTPSCLVLQRCLARQQAGGRPARSLLAVQNPDGTLPFADWEVEEVAKLFPQPRVFAGSKASAPAVKAGIGYGEEKLFSCHGSFHPTDTDQSHLALHDSRLSLPEIVPLNLRGTCLVVMSACETALTDLASLPIDEYHGLPAAFLAAGAQTVVANLWAVNDVSTALLSQRFHANLYSEGMGKAAALREAQLWVRDLSAEQLDQLLEAKQETLFAGARMAAVDVALARFNLRNRGSRPFANPYWWAAFQCIGAGWPARE